MRGYATPANQIPTGADEICVGEKSQIENLARVAFVETLRDSQDGLVAEILAVGGGPDGHVERFLLDLIVNFESAEESARGARANVDGRGVAVFDDSRVWWDQVERRRHHFPPRLGRTDSSTLAHDCAGWLRTGAMVAVFRDARPRRLAFFEFCRR